MPGLLDPNYSAQSGAPGGLLNTGYQPPPDEPWINQLLGSRDPRDPRSAAMNALAVGLLRGDMASGLEGANRAFSESDQRNMQRAVNQLTLTKSAAELQAMQQAQQRQAAIQQQLAQMRQGNGGLPPAQPSGQPSGQPGGMPMPSTGGNEYGVPSVGGVPMFSMAGQGQPSPMQPGGMVRPGGAPGVGGAAPVGFDGGGGDGAGQAQQMHRQLLQMADIYQQNGDTETAIKLYQRAEAFKPKFSTTPQLMRDPRDNQLKYVVQNEDGGYRVLPFGAKPDVTIEDLGDRKIAIDRNAQQDGRTWGKTMTPDARASNALGWANNKTARDRLAFEQNQPELREVNGQLYAIPRTGQGGAMPTGRPVLDQSGAALGTGAGAMDPKLTEVQGNASQFATRMLDATRTMEGLAAGGEKPWPSTVARAGYTPEFPNWLPGGQVLGGGLAALNKQLTPESALQVRQAQDNWITANLRKESGAAIPPAELEQERAKWFPQPGEGDKTAKQKENARKVAEQAMLTQAGPGARLVQRNLDRADAENAKRNGGPAKAQAIPLPSMKPSDLKHGQLYELPGGKVGKWDSLKRGFEVK